MREDAVYFHVILQSVSSLEAVEVWLDKAEQFAAAKKFDVTVLLNSRLAPDQKPFIYQIQSACDYIKAAAAWLSGQAPPKHPDTEQTVEDLRARIRKTVAFVDSVEEGKYAGATDRKVSMTWSPPGKALLGFDYLLQMTIPNTYFHLTTAYSILRHNGVELGKGDFLGPISWVDA
jgi:hypothetical protein